MKIEILKSKLKRVYVTGADPKSEGSITIDSKLMEAANLAEWERVDVNGKKARINTYVLKGDYGSGVIELNGNAAKCFRVGEAIHINSYASVSPLRAVFHVPILVYTDENNKLCESEY